MVRYLNTVLNLVQYSDHHLNTEHLNTRQVKVCYLDVSAIQMFIILIPTVFSNPTQTGKSEEGMLAFKNWTKVWIQELRKLN